MAIERGLEDAAYYSKKHDSGKARFDLLVPEFLEDMANVMTMGARKYSENTWQSVPDGKSRYTAALYRHINAWQQRPEVVDEDSGLSHLAHVAVNAMFLYWLQQHREDKTEVDTNDLFGGNYE